MQKQGQRQSQFNSESNGYIITFNTRFYYHSISLTRLNTIQTQVSTIMHKRTERSNGTDVTEVFATSNTTHQI